MRVRSWGWAFDLTSECLALLWRPAILRDIDPMDAIWTQQSD